MDKKEIKYSKNEYVILKNGISTYTLPLCISIECKICGKKLCNGEKYDYIDSDFYCQEHNIGGGR